MFGSNFYETDIITALDQAKMDKMQDCAQGRIAQALV